MCFVLLKMATGRGGADAETIAKILKNLAQFDETSIMRSVMRMPEQDQRQLRRTAVSVLDGVSTRSVAIKTERQKGL